MFTGSDADKVFLYFPESLILDFVDFPRNPSVYDILNKRYRVFNRQLEN
jgi:hypothetical protein